ncbi:MAG: glutamine synthetase family protein [Candidatus Nealsonbacteria bacterium]|nr:glutamine synthetase family protein [Candidatus Nealsonbacteria bacterium]
MKNFNFKSEKEVLDFLKKNKLVRFVRIIFSDVLGRGMSFTIPSEEMKSAFGIGKGFDGSSVEGFARIEESDLIIVPDPETFRVLPWDYDVQGVIWKEAVVFGDIFNPKGEHFAGDSRYILKKTLEKNKKFGRLLTGPELEFFIFGSEKEPILLDHGGYFYGGKWGEIRKVSQFYLKEMGIFCECDHHEVAPSQHEIDLQYGDALTIADSIILAKYVIKRVSQKLGLFASFMPKPVTYVNGSGMHLHLSLWYGNKNLFFRNKKDSLSDLAKKYLMGLIKYGKEIQLIPNQWINSYKRLIPGYEAPVYLAWGRKNRSAYIRVPEAHLAKAEVATRIEFRSSDPACNIYLVLATIQAAGIQGIKENLKISPPEEKDIYEMTKTEMKKKKIKTLSKNLNEALNLFKKSKLIKETLTPHIFQKIIQNKEIEWQRYKKSVGKRYEKEVSPYEIKEYLPVL